MILFDSQCSIWLSTNSWAFIGVVLRSPFVCISILSFVKTLINILCFFLRIPWAAASTIWLFCLIRYFLVASLIPTFVGCVPLLKHMPSEFLLRFPLSSRFLRPTHAFFVHTSFGVNAQYSLHVPRGFPSLLQLLDRESHTAASTRRSAAASHFHALFFLHLHHSASFWCSREFQDQFSQQFICFIRV